MYGTVLPDMRQLSKQVSHLPSVFHSRTNLLDADTRKFLQGYMVLHSKQDFHPCVILLDILFGFGECFSFQNLTMTSGPVASAHVGLWPDSAFKCSIYRAM